MAWVSSVNINGTITGKHGLGVYPTQRHESGRENVGIQGSTSRRGNTPTSAASSTGHILLHNEFPCNDDENMMVSTTTPTMSTQLATMIPPLCDHRCYCGIGRNYRYIGTSISAGRAAGSLLNHRSITCDDATATTVVRAVACCLTTARSAGVSEAVKHCQCCSDP